MKTHSTRAAEVSRNWHVLDAAGVPLGRLATRAASLIRGKHKVIYAPHLDTGDYVVVVNAAKVALTGRKPEQKRYFSHSQYPGGLKVRSVREQIDRNATRVVEHAIFGMLPHNHLGRALHGHLKVYAGPEHPHVAQVNGPPQPALSQPPKHGERRKRRTPVTRPARAIATPARRAAEPVTTAATMPEDAVGPVATEEAESGAPTVVEGGSVPTEQAQAAESLEESVPTAAPPTEAEGESEEKA